MENVDDVGNIFENVKVDDKLMCSNPMEVSYYSSGLFEEHLLSVWKSTRR